MIRLNRSTSQNFSPSNRQALSLLIVVCCACLLVAILAGVAYFAISRAAATPDDPQLTLGNPSAARSYFADSNNFLMLKRTYALSYNDARGEPNWVSWRLTIDDLGTAPRRDKFSTDVTLPQGYKHVSERDYTGSGFDRGHMCPHGDRMSTREASYGTFIMTNVIPQAPRLNERAWDTLETYCRSLVQKEHDRMYIIDGPAGQGGTGSRGPRSTLAGGSVVVPAECWKVVVVVADKGVDDRSEITADSRVIGVIMPNVNTVGYAWAQYRVPVSDIEQKTGLHFFTALPDDVAAALRTKLDQVEIGPPPHPEWQNRSDEPKGDGD